MKIACASNGNNISGHFGHCEGFTIFEVQKETIVEKLFKPNPGHRPGFLPVFLKDLQVDVIISGGMGETAQQLFKENSIEVIVGAEGKCEDIIENYLKGNLKSTGSVCREHEHEGHCNE